jgi:hypothetical protein
MPRVKGLPVVTAAINLLHSLEAAIFQMDVPGSLGEKVVARHLVLVRAYRIKELDIHVAVGIAEKKELLAWH